MNTIESHAEQMKAKALKITTDGACTFVDVETDENGHIGLTSLQAAVKGDIEHTEIFHPDFMDRDLDVWVNDEGKLIRLPYNEKATLISHLDKYGDYICGDALITSHDDEGNTIGLDDEAIAALRSLMDRLNIKWADARND